MSHWLTTDPELGRLLWFTDGKTEIAAALDFGIRLLHLSCTGRENLFYRQPKDDREFVTEEGWRIYGGHRLWTAPEGDWSYFPDNKPVQWELLENGVVLRQEDPWLGLTKALTAVFLPSGEVQVDHTVCKTDRKPITCGVWGISTLAPGGLGEVTLSPESADEYAPSRNFCLWGNTSITDPRISMQKDRLYIRHISKDDFFKMGLYTTAGEAVFQNFGQRLTCLFGSSEQPYPDSGSNFEIYLSRNMMELETLGGLRTLLPGETAVHREIWRVSNLTGTLSYTKEG